MLFDIYIENNILSQNKILFSVCLFNFLNFIYFSFRSFFEIKDEIGIDSFFTSVGGFSANYVILDEYKCSSLLFNIILLLICE